LDLSYPLRGSMTEYYKIHHDNPQLRLVQKSVQLLRDGGLVAYPTDSGYALGCHLGDKSAHDRLCRIRQVGDEHNFTLICRDLSEVSAYAVFDTPVYRLLKSHTPGPFTFILRATKEVPRRLIHPKRKTIGLRVPDHAIVQAILGELREPMLSTTLILPRDELPMADPFEIRKRLENQIELVIDGGWCGADPTSVVNLMDYPYRILRRGKGDVAAFE
jgi:tRNA threonylcarbamoyl adenosine modification protein (Sua5/YciO/YrdC/YwlC family)